jgi:RHS repeat-associated protein
VPSPTNASTWALDPVGNWNSRTDSGIGVPPVQDVRTHNAANEITAVNTNAVTHDHNGNLTADATQSYAYDEYNRLISVSSVSSVVAEYAYDALGRRILKRTWTGGLTETCFFYDDARTVEEQSCGGGTPATYTHGNYVDEVLTRDTGAQRLYYHQNALSSVVALTDAAGNVVERYTYDTYGSPTIYDPLFTILAASAVGNRILFTGREWDAECALYHYRARTYSPALGRFLSRDPAGYVDALNLYEYVRSRPTGSFDPLGLQAILEWKSEEQAFKIDDQQVPAGVPGKTWSKHEVTGVCAPTKKEWCVSGFKVKHTISCYGVTKERWKALGGNENVYETAKASMERGEKQHVADMRNAWAVNGPGRKDAEIAAAKRLQDPAPLYPTQRECELWAIFFAGLLADDLRDLDIRHQIASTVEWDASGKHRIDPMTGKLPENNR